MSDETSAAETVGHETRPAYCRCQPTPAPAQQPGPMTTGRLAELDRDYGIGGSKSISSTKLVLRRVIHELLDGLRQERKQVRALLDEREQQLATVTADGEHSWALAMERDAAIRRAEQAETELAKHQPGPVLRAWRGDNGDIIHGDIGWVRRTVAISGGQHVIANTCTHVSDWRDAEPEAGDRA